MKRKLLSIVDRIPLRTLRLALYGGLFVVVALAWTAELRQPVQHYRQSQTMRHSLERVVSATPDLTPQVESMRAQVKALDDRLHGSLGRSVLEGQRGMALMGQIDRAAALHGVRLTGVQPMGTMAAAPFMGDVFEVQASGAYAGLIDWLHDIEQSVGTLSLLEFALKTGESDTRLVMTARLVVYRPMVAGEAPSGGAR